MRVLLAHKFFEIHGGAETYFHETGRILADAGHEVAYFATSPNAAANSNSTTFLIPPPQYEGAGIPGRIRMSGRVIYSREVERRFAEVIQSFKPDIVHLFSVHVHLTPSVITAAKDAELPIVMSCNDYKHICPNYKLFHHGRLCEDCKVGRFYKATVNRCCKGSVSVSLASSIEAYAHEAMGVYDQVTTYLFASAFMARETQAFWPKRQVRWRLLRNPFDSPSYPLEEGYGDYALFFGRLVEEKGVDVLLRAAALAPAVHVKVIGDGPEDRPLRDLASRLRLTNVEFVGPQWGPELERILSRARFVVVPSLWHENFPYVIIQAFAHGKPVVASDRGGIPELVRQGSTGLLYEAASAPALAEAMVSMWEDPSRTITMGKAAKAYADSEFSQSRFLSNLTAIYREAIDARVGTRR